MPTFSKEALEKLAHLSGLHLSNKEINQLRTELTKTLAYTKELSHFETQIEHEPITQINVFREDKAFVYDSSAILNQAPERKDTYFVVPKILD